MTTILDGPLGTELNARGVETRLPLWSAAAIDASPDVIQAIHRDYAAAGATVHTANTFRTRRRSVGDRWEKMARRAVELARDSVPAAHRVAGSLAPLEDCYRPDLSPPDPRAEHRELAEVLADAGCDLLLCETFPHVGEAIVAAEEAVRTGVKTWVSFTAGPKVNLLTPAEMAEGAKRAAGAGASAVLVNCTPATETLRFIEAIASQNLSIPIGAYANAGSPDDKIGWASAEPDVKAYVDFAKQWIEAGATIIGGCCGTGPAHIAAVAGMESSRSCSA